LTPGLPLPIVFVSPVKSGFLAKFGLTVTVTGVPVNPC